jgi:hypothetical protein
MRQRAIIALEILRLGGPMSGSHLREAMNQNQSFWFRFCNRPFGFRWLMRYLESEGIIKSFQQGKTKWYDLRRGE